MQTNELIYMSYRKEVQTRLLSQYNIRVVEARLSNDITGDFNGHLILIRSDMTEEMKLFIILHLFGHTVQFSTSGVLMMIGMTKFGPENINDDVLGIVVAYEHEAARYGLQLLHQIGITGMDQWMSDWSNGDLEYLLHLYRSGERYHLTLQFLLDYKKKWIKPDSRLIEPKSIPSFTQQKWTSRFSF